MTDTTYTRNPMANALVGRAILWGGILGAILGCRSSPETRGIGRSSHSDIQAQFTSYEDALRLVRITYDCDAETVNRSSVVYGAEYCDVGNGEGYLIVNLRGREYIHAGVPQDVWDEFRNAESMGSYYASNLRGHYRLTLAY